jgi:hypothetical protein
MPITINGSGSLTGVSVGGLPTGVVDTATLANNAVTYAKIGTTEQGQLCKAWVNFDGTGNGTFAGGTSTVTRTAGSTTATVTTTNAHGLITGNTVYALTGVAAGAYTVTVLTTTTFTITTVATTALSAASITFAVNTIRASYNVSSITDNGVGDYTVNFTTALADAQYALTGTHNGSTQNLNPRPDSLTASAARFVTTGGAGAGTGVSLNNVDPGTVSVAIFR